MIYDLVIQNGTLIDPAAGIHARRDVAFADGRVAAVGENLVGERAIDAGGALVIPGMIDLHAHVYDAVTWLSVPPDPNCLARGTTTVLDAGSAGADTFAGFRKFIIERSRTRIFAALNISGQGLLSPDIGEHMDIRWSNVARAVEVVEANRDIIVAIKVRVARETYVSGEAGMEPLYRAREAADATGLPLMVHPQQPWSESLADVLDQMRAGDIFTHCYHAHPQNILENAPDETGPFPECVREARARGVIFDVGHGEGSFSWPVAERALAENFPPDTISTDLHALNVNGPVFDLPATMAKLIHLGVSLEDAVAMVTARPAKALNMEGEIGTLAPGAAGDAVVLRVEEGAFPLTDGYKETRTASVMLSAAAVVRDGEIAI